MDLLLRSSGMVTPSADGLERSMPFASGYSALPVRAVGFRCVLIQDLLLNVTRSLTLDPLTPGFTASAAVTGAQPGAFAAQQPVYPTSGAPPQQEMLAPAAGPARVDGPGLEAESKNDGSGQQVYNPEALRLKLESVQTVDRTLEEVEADVRAACGAEGIALCVVKSSRAHDGVSERYDMKKLTCRRGGANRQASYQNSLSVEAEPGRRRRQSSGRMKSGCPFEVTIRHAKSHPHPKVTNLKTDHNHVINRKAIAVKMRLAGKLTEEQKDQVAKMTAQGMKPKYVTTALGGLHPDSSVELRAVQHAAAFQTGVERPFNASDAYEQAMLATTDGGVCEVEMDEEGRLLHIWWQTKGQVSLWNRNGGVALYNDTAVKNRYRRPISVVVVIDSENRTRIVGQSITADTTTGTFVWMLKCALRSREGKQPDIFIQDADAAMAEAVRHVFPDAQPRRCLWHLYQSINKALAEVLGGEMNAFMDGFKCARQQVSVEKFEAKFEALVNKYPKTENYLNVIYDDREQWAEYVSPLAFSVGSWTSRVEGQNALIKDKCNAHMSLLDVTRCFSEIIDRQSDATELGGAMQHLLPVEMATQAAIRFKGVLDACEFPIALWPRRFMEQEMAAAIMHCQLDGGEVDGPQRAAALKHTFEYIETKLCDVTLVFGVHEERDSKPYDHLILLFSDGSHLCQCRTLQVIGLGCRHFWAAMLHNPRFRFHVGLLDEHWLTEKARGTPEKNWPSAAAPKWIVADRHAGTAGTMEDFEEATSETGGGGGWKAFAGSSQTIRTVLLELTEKGPTVQDRQILYADVSKILGQAANILSDSMPLAMALTLAESFLASVSSQAQAHNGVGAGVMTFVPNPGSVRQPARSSGLRKRGAAEAANSRTGSKKNATCESR